MQKQHPLSRVINLISSESQRLWSIDESEARRRMLTGDVKKILEIDGSFALLAQDGERVVLARSLDRPMRYFLAKSTDGPVLILADRIDDIAAELAHHDWTDQFHPSYTRSVPAHHVTTLRLVAQDASAPIGVPFSGGIDSGAILLRLYKLLLNEGQSPARVKSFTPSVDAEGDDARQVHDFLIRTNLEILGEIIDVPSRALDP